MKQLAIALLIHATAIFGAEVTSPLRGVSWNLSAKDNVCERTWSRAQILDFLSALPMSPPNDSKGFAPIGISGESLKVFEFRDLDRDGVAELIAVFDYHSTGPFAAWVVTRSADGFQLTSIPAVNGETIEQSVIDIDGDGRFEILVPTAYMPGIDGQFYWNRIFASDHEHRFVDRSSAYPAYYKDTALPAVERMISELKIGELSKADTRIGELRLDGLRALRDKILRMVDSESTAGINDAIVWSKDADPTRRKYAAAVAKDLNNWQGDAILNTLENDVDDSVRAIVRGIKDQKRLHDQLR